MSSTCFKPKGSSSGSMYDTLYHTCTYNHLPEDEPLGLKHVEDIKN